MMSPHFWIVASLLSFAAPIAEASVPPLAGTGPLSISLNVPQDSSRQRYSDTAGGACLVLDAGRPLGDQDAAGLHRLIQDLDVQAGPGVLPQFETAQSKPFTYSLVPVLEGTRLIYRGLLSSKRGSTVQVNARGPASLNEVVERDLGFTGPISLAFTRDCN